MDTLEDTDQFDEDSKYSVDAYAQGTWFDRVVCFTLPILAGNWTRFVKYVSKMFIDDLRLTLILGSHSCEPNVQVYSVVWDTPPGVNDSLIAVGLWLTFP